MSTLKRYWTGFVNDLETCPPLVDGALAVCLHSDVQRVEARVKSLEGALKIAHQALLEVAHAQAAGANWYTRGASGLYQQVAMWVRKGREAIAAQHL